METIDNKVTYDSVIAAKYLMALAFKKKKVLNVTKVQKLLYIAYGFFLANKNRVLINETPKAWPYGPVFPQTRERVDYSEVINTNNSDLIDIKEDDEVSDFFNKLIDIYSDYTASQLSEWSHIEGGPWHKTTKKRGFYWDTPISDELIKEYFSKLKF